MKTRSDFYPDRDTNSRKSIIKSGISYYYNPNFPCLTFGATAGNLARNTDYYFPVYIETASFFVEVACEVTGTYGVGAMLRMGLYASDINLQPIGAPLFDSGDIDSENLGVKTASINIEVPRGLYLGCFNSGGSSSGAMRELVGGGQHILTTMGASPYISFLSVARSHAAFPTPGTAWNSVSTSTLGLAHILMYNITQ